MRLKYLSLFPEMIRQGLDHSLTGKALQNGLFQTELIQIRDFTTDKHRTVDEPPYGGGEGMVIKADVLHRAWESARADIASEKKSVTVFVTPQGRLFDQAAAKELAQFDEIIFVCGHYEAIDERFVEACVDREYSIGDYVLTGGELPALVMTDAIVRLLPGTLGNSRSITEESLEGGLLKYPQYTRPAVAMGRPVPAVLTSGDHGAIADFRQKEREKRTRERRPDLWQRYVKQSTDV